MSSREPPDRDSLPFEIEANVANHLTWIKTVLGLQRTLMSAERTAVTLIAFGFTVAQVFRNLEADVPPHFLVLGPHLPRNVGLLMITAGVTSLALFTWQYLRAVAYLGSEPFAAISIPFKTRLHHLTCFTAYAIMLLGVLGFASVFVIF